MGKAVKKVASVATGGLYKPKDNSAKKEEKELERQQQQAQQAEDQIANRNRQNEANADALSKEPGTENELGGVLTTADGLTVNKKKLNSKGTLGG